MFKFKTSGDGPLVETSDPVCEDEEKQMDKEQLVAFKEICESLENLPNHRQIRVLKAVAILLEIDLT